MEISQIVILIFGALLFTVSFFIPDKKVNTKEIRDKEEQIFRELMEREVPNIRKMIDEEADESIEYARENTQRQMERLTNEKMMAINEYSDTVMREIHKNHEEAVFLYDMLNNKHAQVKNISAELNQVMKQFKQIQMAAKSVKAKDEKETKTSEKEKTLNPAHLVESATAVSSVETDIDGTMLELEKELDFEPMLTKDLEVIIPPDDFLEAEKEWKKAVDNATVYDEKNVEILFATEEKGLNKNERILEMNRAGKSNMAIAKELGLGIGEVKLVIDLFKGEM